MHWSTLRTPSLAELGNNAVVSGADEQTKLHFIDLAAFSSSGNDARCLAESGKDNSC